MDYKHFDPGTVERTPDPAPDQAALLAQIEADHYIAKQRGDRGLMKLLDERHKKVSGAKTAAAARKAYETAIKEPRRGSGANDE